MSFTLRRAAGTAVLALAASALTLPLAPAASATTPTETQYFLSDTDGDVVYELWKRSTPAGTATKVAGDATHDISDLSISQDGSRLVYLQTTLSSAGDPLSEQVVVRDIGGRLVRTVSSALDTGSTGNFLPAISPDGNTVAWTSIVSGQPRIVQASAAVGGATLVQQSYYNPVFLNSSTLLAQNLGGSWFTFPLTGGTPASSSLPGAANDVTVSPSGAKIAWSLDTTGAGNYTSDLQIADLSFPGGVPTIGSATSLATGLDNIAPAFSTDSATVYFVKWDGDVGPGDIWSSPADNSVAETVTVTTAGDEFDVAIGTTDDGTAPGTTIAQPALLNGSGSGALLVWGAPGDADLSGFLITRTLGSTVQKSNVYTPGWLGQYTDTGLLPNYTYTYTIQAVDRSGNLGPAVTEHVTSIKPLATFSDPTSATTAKAPFVVHFGPAGTPNSATFSVDYLVGGTTTWHHWVTSTAGVSRVFGSAASTGVAATTSVPGSTYTFRVKAVDTYGNYSNFVTSGKAVVPFDQTKASFVGGSTISSAAYWLGSEHVQTVAGNAARINILGSRFQIIGMRCTKCGVIDIYDGSTRVATIDTYRSATLLRTVLYTRTWSSVGSHAMLIKVRGTTGRPYVYLDGFGVRR